MDPFGNCTFVYASLDSQRLYVIFAVGIATMSFFLNTIQIVVLIHQGLLKYDKNIIVLNLCLCGQLASGTVIWYIHKIVRDADDFRHEDTYPLCFILLSAVHLLTVYTFAPLVTTLVLMHHLVSKHKGLDEMKWHQMAVIIMVSLSWCEGMIISLLPLASRNNWRGYCAIPLVWSSAFTVIAGILYFCHLFTIVFLLADMRFSSSKKRRTVSPSEDEQRIATIETPDESLDRPETPPESTTLQTDSITILLFTLLTFPFVCYILHVSYQRNSEDFCANFVSNEQAAMWTSWFIIVFATLRPLYQMFSEDDIGTGTGILIAAVCRQLCHRNKRNEITR